VTDDAPKIAWKGRHLSMAVRDGWEYATRNTGKPAVGIVAITDSGCVVLVEQERPPVGGMVIELPAGLAGDVPGGESEELVAAARRELLEETGYAADRWTELCVAYSSPGLSDEKIVLFLAEGLRREAAGGGVEGERISLHEVPLGEVLPWLEARGAKYDMKLLAALFAAQAARQ
jgi:ADP-ribose pyrophosphatase